MKVVLINDHAMVRAGIGMLVNHVSGFHIVGEASNKSAALDLVRQLQPDVVISDIGLGSDRALDLLQPILKASPATRIIILSVHASEELVAESLRLGAAAYLSKEAGAHELEMALRAVVSNKRYLSSCVSRTMLESVLPAEPAVARDLTVPMLTARQCQILTMIASRKSTKEIAYELDLSEKTIAAHRSQIMERIGIRDVAGLVLFAVRHGLVVNPGHTAAAHN